MPPDKFLFGRVLHLETDGLSSKPRLPELINCPRDVLLARNLPLFRGMSVPALREFILREGPSRNILNLEWGALGALDKKYIDPEAARYTALVQEDVVTCYVTGIDSSAVATKPKYIKNPDLGLKKVVYYKKILLEQVNAQSLVQNDEITLLNWGNAYARRISRSDELDRTGKQKITGIDFELHLEGDVKKTKKISWLASVSSNLILVDLVSLDYLITKDKLEKEERLEDFLEAIRNSGLRLLPIAMRRNFCAGQLYNLSARVSISQTWSTSAAKGRDWYS